MPCPTDPSISFGFLLADAARAVRRQFQRRGADLGISASQWRLLVQVMRCGALPQARLAELLEIEPISVSRLVDRMQEAGWLIRYPDAEDRRIKLVDLTEKSRATFADMRCIADDIYSEALQGVSPEAYQITRTALLRLIRNLSEPTGTQDE
ncbi:MarR family winged helix-turn-helix transcriptional regulator [Paenirhodobacter enshiensis]|uniref:MarR family transcriptional regulator n=1 Tax=Paenirhodobacter enshiensis TaxID=1105367 RepID=A0A086Y4D1_9RHOB|nr:MarR family transcriptional regulator [Paenirhodobacter enshiensis]KFI29131.1 MarR family transcriptional regulator [Paenirhodobacter enshiensis]